MSRKLALIKVILFSGLLWVAGSQMLLAQTFEEFKRQRQEGFDRFKEEYDRFISQMQQQYDDYVKQRDAEFVAFLRERWDEYQIFAGKQKTAMPKPTVAPVFIPDQAPASPRQIVVATPSVPVVVQEKRVPVLPSKQKTEDEPFSTRNAEFYFYRNKITLRFDPSLVMTIPTTINNIAISNFWNRASNANYNHFISQLTAYRAAMNLNDWGYYLLVKNAAKELYPNSENGSTLLTWFLMNRSGFKARAAFSNNQAMLLLASENNIYEVSFQEFDGIRYYLVLGNARQIYTYDEDFPGAVRLIDMNINSPVNLGEVVGTRQMEFTYGGITHQFNFEYCRNLIAFYNDYPQTDISVYFNSSISPVAKESIAQQLAPILEGKSEWDAVSFLLRLVQTEFEYKVDREQFGREKFFFAEEVFHYPFSDCEDRSVLFAYLVRELLNKRVIGLKYHDHLATAVKFNHDAAGDYFIHRGDRFIMADPTFINAPLGLTMPQYVNASAQILDIDNIQYVGMISDRIWDIIFDAGGRRAGTGRDIVFDLEGNAFVAGYFSGSIWLGEFRLQTAEDNNGAFLAKFDRNLSLVWVRQPTGQHNATAYHVALDNQQNVFVAGTFDHKITFGHQTLVANENSDVFLAKFGRCGKLLWASQASVYTVNPDYNFMFVARFGSRGQHTGTDIFMENENFTDWGISFDIAGNPILVGSSFSNLGMNVKAMAYDEAAAFDAVLSLKAETDQLLAQGVNQGIAGLLAAINLIRLNNVVLSGREAQKALDRFNPNFRRAAPAVYNNLGRINFLRNDQGVVYITTENNRTITIEYLRITNNSTVKINTFRSGNAQIDILSGISVGKAVVWYDLNFVRLFRDTGNLLFDFSDNNTQRTINIARDMLQ